eukprot:3930073-Pleurochrysis_carterae.AAC.2
MQHISTDPCPLLACHAAYLPIHIACAKWAPKFDDLAVGHVVSIHVDGCQSIAHSQHTSI